MAFELKTEYWGGMAMGRAERKSAMGRGKGRCKKPYDSVIEKQLLLKMDNIHEYTFLQRYTDGQ